MKEIDCELEEILNYYREQMVLTGPAAAGSQELLVELLREIQELYGWIDEESQKAAAETMGMSQTVISKIIKLYPSFKSRPSAYGIVVCTGKNCGSKGGMQLLEAVRREVERRPAGLFEITTRNCLKHCRTSPNLLMIHQTKVGETFQDDQMFEQVQADEVSRLLDKFGPLS